MSFFIAAIMTVFLLFSGCDTTDPEPKPIPEPEEIEDITAAPDFIVEFDAHRRSHEIADTMWGIFYEDINYAADGGLYPEMVKNRSFEFRTTDKDPVSRPIENWSIPHGNSGAGSVTGSASSPLNVNNPRYAAVNVTTAGYAIANRGYGFGSSASMVVTAGAKYNFYLKIICRLNAAT